jgi:uncharacterized protein (DUF2141 family)
VIVGLRERCEVADPAGSGARVEIGCRSDAGVVAIVHDTNGNGRVDTNLVGLPTEQWGVSRNVRHGLRAPRFHDASIKLAGGAAPTVIDIEAAR